MSGIPEEWVEIKTEEVFNQIPTTNKKVKTKNCFPSGKYPVVDQGQNLICGYLNDLNKVIRLKKPIVIFGDHTRTTKWVDFDFIPGADGTKILEAKTFLNNRFFYFQLKSIQLLDKGYARHFRLLKESSFKVPSLPEQNEIVSRLERLLGQVDGIKKRMDGIPAILKSFRQSVLSAAVNGKLTEKWRGTEELVGWEEKSFDEIIDRIEAGKNFNCPSIPVSKDTVGIVKISAVTSGVFNTKETKTVIDESRINKKLFIKKDDLLVTRANTLELVGASTIVDEINYKIMISDKVWKIIVNNIDTKKIIDIYLKSSLGRQQIESRATGNQFSMRNISQKAFKQISINLPPLEEQKEIVKRVESYFALADSIESKVQEAQKRVDHLTQSILAKAFCGDLTKEWRELHRDLITGDNSAFALLERIKEERETLKTKTGKNPLKKKVGDKVLVAAESGVSYG